MNIYYGYDITFTKKKDEKTLKDKILGGYELYKIYSPGIINNFQDILPKNGENIKITHNQDKIEVLGNSNKAFIYKKETKYKLFDLLTKNK